MNHFGERLPWRIAALAGLLVGAVSWINGVDLWVCLARVGAAFAVFGLLGCGLTAILRPSRTRSHAKPNRPGNHLDETIPEMTVDDLHPAENLHTAENLSRPHPTDESER